MQLISNAYAQEESLEFNTEQTAPLPEEASPWELFGTNVAVVLVLVILFYVLLIMPQQRRLKEHTHMLNALKKGDRVITGGGLVGTIEKVEDAKGEVVINLGSGVKVTALRSTIQAKDDPRLRQEQKPANDQSAQKKENKENKK